MTEFVCGGVQCSPKQGGQIAEPQKETMDSCWFVGVCSEKMYMGN